MKTIISIILLTVLIISCAPVLPANSLNKTTESPKQVANVSMNQTNTTNTSASAANSTLATATEVSASPNASIPRKEVVEGELVNFPGLRASDPDGDPITYTFSKPLTEKGEWRTNLGDAGEYPVT